MSSTVKEPIIKSNVCKIQEINTDRVYVEDTYMSNAFAKEIKYLLSIDDDKMLAGFRDTAGIDMKGATRYAGWESMLIGGHTMGHYLSALAQSYINATISAEDKDKIYKKIEYIADSLYECQQNSKGKEGFIFGAQILDRTNVEIQFDNIENGKGHIITEAWVPWYTVHKILSGLVDAYKFTGIEKALKVAENLGMWSYNRASSWSEEKRLDVLCVEYGGMNDVLYELYKYSGKEEIAIAAHLFDEDRLFEKINSGIEDALDGRHANTTIPKFMGALNRYYTMHGNTVKGQKIDASKYLEYAEAFFDMVVKKHTYATGGNSEWEHFGRDYVLDAERTNANNETCNTYNMLKMARKLFEITGNVKYLDYYEKAFINSILSSQNPETGMTTYFQPMASGYFKVYGEETTKFWCCTGTGMENFTKLGDSLYFENEDTIYVAMYFSSKIFCQNGSELQITADLKTSDKIQLQVLKTDLDKKIALRIPYWMDEEMMIQINGKEVATELKANPGFVTIEADLKENDVITVELPMKVYTEALPDEQSSMALCYGPYVLSADLGCEDKKVTTTGVDVTIPEFPIVENQMITIPEEIDAKTYAAEIEKHVTPKATADHTIAFKVENCNYTFAPHYLKYTQRYGIYFYYKNRKEQLEYLAKKAAEDKKVIDTIEAGYGQYENDELHNLIDNGSIGTTSPIISRRAKAASSFTYHMAVNKEVDNTLSLTVLAEDDGKSLKISSGEIILFQKVLDHKELASEEVKKYDIEISIPKEVIAGAKEIEAYGRKYDVIPVTISGTSNEESARVVDYIYTYESKIQK